MTGVRIDTHRHAWDVDALPHPWLARRPDLPRRADVPDDAGPTVLVEAGVALGSEAAEAAKLVWLADRATNPRRVVAALPWQGVVPLNEWAQEPLIAGVRITTPDVAPSAGARHHLAGLMARAHDHGLVVDLLTDIAWLAVIPDMAGSGTVVMDHLVNPRVAVGLNHTHNRAWSEALRAAADVPNIVWKLSGLAPGSDSRRSLAEQCAPFLDIVGEACAADRLMVGSDLPVSTHPDLPLPESWTAIVTDRLGEDAAMLRTTAERVYGFGLDPQPEPRLGATGSSHHPQRRSS